MSDTPRTDDRVVFIDGNPWVNAPFARELERELNAANQRIKRLEEAGDELLRDNDDMANINRWWRAKEADALDLAEQRLKTLHQTDPWK